MEARQGNQVTKVRCADSERARGGKGLESRGMLEPSLIICTQPVWRPRACDRQGVGSMPWRVLQKLIATATTALEWLNRGLRPSRAACELVGSLFVGIARHGPTPVVARSDAIQAVVQSIKDGSSMLAIRALTSTRAFRICASDFGH